MSIRHKWHIFARLSPQDRWLIIRAMILLTVLTLALKVTSLQRVQAFLSRSAPKKQTDARAAYIAHLVGYAERNMIVHPTCLPRSLTLWHLLRQHGIDSTIRLGARKTESGQFEAHAWVEYQGTVLNDRPDIATIFAAFPESATKNAS